MRRKLKKPLTDRARCNIVTKLVRIEALGDKAESVLNQSITNSWQDVYPIRVEDGNRGRARNTPSSDVPRAAWTPEASAARDQREESAERRAYEMWTEMSAAYKSANPWAGRKFELVGA